MSIENTIEKTIADFKVFLNKLTAYNHACALISWNMHTDSPKGGMGVWVKTVGQLSTDLFKMTISQEMKDFLSELEPHLKELDEQTGAMYRICKKNLINAEKIPVEEMREYQELVASSQQVWEAAKAENDYQKFAPCLDKIIKMNKKFLEYKGYTGHAYSKQLDDYEPGMTVEKLDDFFAKVKQTIVPLLRKISESKATIDNSFLSRHVSRETQQKISALLMEKLDYSLNCGMLKESVHPFTINFSKYDVRITTNYHETQFLSSFFSVIHEVGHALYEQNKSDDIGDTILDSGISMGIHESQSRFYENVIGRSREFIGLIYDELMEILGEDFKDVTPDMMYKAVNTVNPSLIRIEADELTYSLHIMVRYEMEKMLFGGDYDINELPRLWNEKYQEYLGITPTTDAEGILQDVHWSGGMLGYFPSYSLGNAYASQILATMQKEMDIYELITQDKIGEITGWLTDKIHKYGSIYEPNYIIKNLSGEELNADYYVKYLTDKFTAVYGL